MKRIRNILPIGLLAITTHLSAAILTGPVTNTANGHLYYLLTSNTWSNSESEALSLGGHLATIRNAAENAFVTNAFSAFADVPRDLWIGLSDVAVYRNFVWASGESSAYRNWSPGPDGPVDTGGERYVHIIPPGIGDAGRWDDFPNTSYPDRPGYGVVEVIPPRLSIRFSQVEMRWPSVTNRSYQVQYRSVLTTNLWTDLGTPVAGTGSELSVLDGIPPGYPQRFYRVAPLP